MFIQLFSFSLFVLTVECIPSLHMPLINSSSISHFDNTFVTPSTQTLIRRVREIAAATDSDFSWKVTKTPTFVTTQMKKQNAEPILTVHQPYSGYRDGRAHDMPLSPHAGAKRIVYYSTLPDVPYQPTRSSLEPYSDFVSLPVPIANQRSYDSNKVGKDFVTRVQSSIINVGPPPRGDNKNKVDKSNPTFTIIDAPQPPTNYPINSINRIMHPDYRNKHMTTLEYHQPPYSYLGDKLTYPRPYIHDFKIPYSSSLPYYNSINGIDKNYYQLPQYQYQHQSSPYYNDVEKIQHPHHIHHISTTSTHYHSPPYPSRHTRFPADRYPLGSPFSDLMSSSRPFAPPLTSNMGESAFPASSLDFNSPSTVSSGFDFNDNLGPVTMDHNADLDSNRFSSKPLSQRNKFPNFNFDNQANKYFDVDNNFNSDFPYKYPEPPSDSPFSQISNLLTNNFDFNGFSAAAAAANNAASSDKGYHIKGSSFGESQNQNSTTEAANTMIPLLSENTEETQTDSTR